MIKKNQEALLSDINEGKEASIAENSQKAGRYRPLQASEGSSVRIRRSHFRIHSGPLPPPEIFNQYDIQAQKFWMEITKEARQDASVRAVKVQQDSRDINFYGRKSGFVFAISCVVGAFSLALVTIMLPDLWVA